MKSILSICVALLIVAACGAGAYCQNDSLVANMKTLDGNVVSVDNQNSQVVVKASEAMVFSVLSDAKIVNADGYDMQLSDVQAGSYATVDYYDDKSGKHMLTGMEVEYKY
jgi:hypothetical protein